MRRAFTLIEVMIAVAVFAIVVSAGLIPRMALARLGHEADLSLVAREARLELGRLEKVPFRSLPPQVCSAGDDGWIQLGQGDLVPGSLEIHFLDSGYTRLEPLEVDLPRGRVRVPHGCAGLRVVVNYSYYLLELDETHLVGSDLRVELDHGPAVRVAQVWLARGGQLVPLEGWRLEQGVLRLPLAARGSLVSVDYRGERWQGTVRGRFLDEHLASLDRPGPVKALDVQVDYGPGCRLSLSTLSFQGEP